MTLLTYQVFKTVADIGSFHKAADILGLTPSAVSHTITNMEKELGLHFNSWITWLYTQGIGKTKGLSPRHDDILMFTKDKKDFVFNCLLFL